MRPIDTYDIPMGLSEAEREAFKAGFLRGRHRTAMTISYAAARGPSHEATLVSIYSALRRELEP